MDTQRTYGIDRKTASRLLKISTRSVDRYIRSGKLSAKQVRGRIFLSREDIESLQEGRPFSPQMRTPVRHEPIILTEHPVQSDGKSLEMYRDLYDEASRALDEKNRKLEQANYRIGQLESQVGSHFPMKFMPTQDGSESASTQMLRQSLMTQEKQNAELAEKIRKEKMNRNVLTTILYILLALQPVLWYFLRRV